MSEKTLVWFQIFGRFFHGLFAELSFTLWFQEHNLEFLWTRIIFLRTIMHKETVTYPSIQAVQPSVWVRKSHNPIGRPSRKRLWRQPTRPGCMERNSAGLWSAPPTHTRSWGLTSRRPIPPVEFPVTGEPSRRYDPNGKTWGRTYSVPTFAFLVIKKARHGIEIHWLQ